MKKQKKLRNRTNKQSKQIFILLALIGLVFTLQTPKKYKSMYEKVGQTFKFTRCSTSAYLYKIVLKSGLDTRISFPSPVLTGEDKPPVYIKKLNSKHEYLYTVSRTGMYCDYYKHEDKYKDIGIALALEVILLITGTGHSDNMCKIERIITRIPKAHCGGKPSSELTPLTEILGLNKPGENLASFDEITYDKSKIMENTVPLVVSLEGFTAENLTQEHVEMMLLGPLTGAWDVNMTWAVEYDSSMIDTINEKQKDNLFSSMIKKSRLIPRLFYKNLPGYFLGNNHDFVKKDEAESKLQYVDEWGVGKFPNSIVLTLCVTNYRKFKTEESLFVNIRSKGYKHHFVNSNNYKDLDYRLKISRTVDCIKAELFPSNPGNSKLLVESSYESPSSPSGSFLYISMAIGTGIVRYHTLHSARVRHSYTLSFKRLGTEAKSTTNFEDEDNFSIEALFSRTIQFTRMRWTEISYTPPPAHKGINLLGLRVTELYYAEGVYPAHLVVENTITTGCEDYCILAGFKGSSCVQGTFLLQETSTFNKCARVMENMERVDLPGLVDKCRVASQPDRCLIAKGDYLLHIEPGIRHPMKTDVFLKADHDFMNPKEMSFYQRFTNYDGKTYYLSCPYDCK